MKGLILLANGFEEAEAIITIDILRRAKLDVTLASVGLDLTVTSSHNIQVLADTRLSDVISEEYGFLIIPGGLKSVLTFHSSSLVSEIVEEFVLNQKIIGAICAGPTVLSRLGLLKGKKFTCFPGLDEYLKSGAYHPEKEVIVANNIITARAMAHTIEFALEIVKKILGKEEAKRIEKAITGIR
ncbi:MAG TPA: DJ-1/PfpI family protein [Bacilli bacterium]|nr:DJ-1/PfpI family protein [Bacilli bacterium]HOF42981.1 DJ-1/PfpI family protein [Bacilli bacterium]HOR52867.1 DJ-1/PfpI family protein [Bacilli bacterium]HPL58757.1 DJ-1/PfpI family protein [Bacilli bacterium]